MLVVCDSRIAWPPVACLNPQLSKRGALKEFCSPNAALAAQYLLLWAVGIELLKEHHLVALLQRSRRAILHNPVLRRDIVFWHDSYDTAALTTVKDVFELDSYNVLDHLRRNFTRGDWVIDLGGHLGSFTLLASLAAPAARVLVVEPSPWNYMLLCFNLLQNGLDSTRVRSFRVAIGGTARTDIGYHHRHSSVASCLKSRKLSDRHDTYLSKFNVSIVTLPFLMRALRIRSTMLLKLDCEGCEWETALQWQRNGVWRSIRAVVGELHAYADHCDAVWEGMEDTTVSAPSSKMITKWWDARCHPPEMKRIGELYRFVRLLCAGDGKFRMEGACESVRAV